MAVSAITPSILGSIKYTVIIGECSYCCTYKTFTRILSLLFKEASPRVADTHMRFSACAFECVHRIQACLEPQDPSHCKTFIFRSTFRRLLGDVLESVSMTSDVLQMRQNYRSSRVLYLQRLNMHLQVMLF